MKTILPLSVILVGLFSSVASASVDVAVVCTSRALRVASVKTLDDGATWYVLQQAFSTSFAASLTELSGTAMPIKMMPQNAASAADGLESGACDAVVVFGEQLPMTLRNGKFVSIKAVAQIGTPVRVFHFVMRKDDPSMMSALTSAFEHATSSAAFQDTVGRSSTVRVVASNLTR